MISELKELLKNRFSVFTALLHCARLCFDIFRMSKHVRHRMVNVTGIGYIWIGHISPFVLKEKYKHV